MNSWINLDALWKIVVFGLVAGAGLPALFAVGMFSLSRGPKTANAGPDSDVVVGGSAAGLFGALLPADADRLSASTRSTATTMKQRL